MFTRLTTDLVANLAGVTLHMLNTLLVELAVILHIANLDGPGTTRDRSRVVRSILLVTKVS